MEWFVYRCFHGLRGVWYINLAKLKHLGCLLEGLALPQCSRYGSEHLKIRRYLLFFQLENIPLSEFKVSVWLFFPVLIPLQLTRAILENPKDKTNVHLIYANVSYDDILLKVCMLPYLSFFLSYLHIVHQYVSTIQES